MSERTIKWILVTQTGTPDSEVCNRLTEQRRALKAGMRKIPYHYVILKDGRVETGRPLDEASFVLQGYNGDSLAVALAGETANELQKDALFNLVEQLVKEHRGSSVFDLRD